MENMSINFLSLIDKLISVQTDYMLGVEVVVFALAATIYLIWALLKKSTHLTNKNMESVQLYKPELLISKRS